jgi:hypothetical protein
MISSRIVKLWITATAAILEIPVIRIHALVDGKDSETTEFYNDLQHPTKKIITSRNQIPGARLQSLPVS